MFSKEGEELHVKDILECKLEVEEEKETGSSATARAVKALLQGGLAASIRSLMAEETAKAVKKAILEERTRAANSGEVVHSPRSSGGSSPCPGTCRDPARRTRAGGEILEPFDPDSKDCNVDRWLAKIDQLGEVHGWSAYERAYFMQAKLKGGARAWFNRLDDYNMEWGEWRSALATAFPWQHDYATLLNEMLARKKKPNESMTGYYHAKLRLIERCEIRSADAVSCLIDGLPPAVRGNARAFGGKTVGELFSGFLSTLDRYREEPEAAGPKKRRYLEVAEAEPSAARAKVSAIRCYNCQQFSNHLSRDCPKPKAERCMRCGQMGHDARSCPQRKDSKGNRC